MSTLAERLRLIEAWSVYDQRAARALWPELCAVVEKAGRLRERRDKLQLVRDEDAFDAAWAALARRMDEEGL